MDMEYKKFDNKSELYDFLRGCTEKAFAEIDDITAALANISAILGLELDDTNWAGFYLMKNGSLVLGPFQGKPAVAQIAAGEGVCGTAVKEGKTQIVSNVHKCSNHIACDPATSSEIVVPIYSNGTIAGVIDIDSPLSSRFDEEDAKGLEAIAGIIGEKFS